MWIHLVPDSRSDPYRIHQVPWKRKAYPYQFHTGSKRIRSLVNAALNNALMNVWNFSVNKVTKETTVKDLMSAHSSISAPPKSKIFGISVPL